MQEKTLSTECLVKKEASLWGDLDVGVGGALIGMCLLE